MLKRNEWTFWVKMEEIPKDCVLAMSISDDVLDKDCWPVWCVVVQSGHVVHVHDMYRSDVYDRPDMIGWNRKQIAEWVQEADGAGTTHPQISHDICWITAPEDKDYWFCVNIKDDLAMKHALSIFAYYKVDVRFMGNGDEAEIAIVADETREGDLILAEMAFSAPGYYAWRQAKVCPICEDNGETICGHMYFRRMVQPAF